MRSIPNRRSPRRIQRQAPREQPGGAALLAENGLTDQEIATRKAFLEFGPGDAQRLAALAPLARKYAGDVIEDLYAHFLSFSSTREFFRDQPTLRRVKRLQKRYFLRLTSGRYDRNYIANRLLVGAVHERIGLGAKLYLGAYRRYLDAVAWRLWGGTDGARGPGFETFRSLLKLVFLDIGLALDTYVSQREHTIRVQNQELAEQYRRIQEANRLKSEFLANMSHELRTPLNAIIGFSELLHDGKAGPIGARQREYLADCLTNTRHLLGLINDVLDLAKVESGTMRFNPEPIDLAELVREVTQSVEAAAARKRLGLDIEIDPRLAAPMLDRARLKQVLFNYLANAVKFTGHEGRVMVRVREDADGGDLVIEVEDTGIGISKDDLPRLFTQFQQLDGSSSKKYQGTGLGLAITRQLVEAQGGTVGVRSTPGRGSTFYARLPLRHTAAQPGEPGSVDRGTDAHTGAAVPKGRRGGAANGTAAKSVLAHPGQTQGQEARDRNPRD